MSDNSHKAEMDAARTEIDAADREILKLLEARLNAVRAIGALKGKDTESPLFDPARERAVLENWTHEAEARGLSGYFTGRILKEVLNYSRRSQEDFMSPESKRSTAEQITVGYQGATCSYSHLAIGKLFATRGVSGVERQGYRTFSDAIDALERGEIDFALLPVENTISGSISEVNQILARNGLHVVDEEIWPVEHCLAALPESDISDITSVRSHHVALQQCHRFLSQMPSTEARVWFDTAGAARSVMRDGDPSVATICPEEAAAHFGLNVLRRGISDQPRNLTRFVLIGMEAESCNPKQESRTSLVFTLNHREGALAGFLQAFADEQINLTRIESRPQPETPWEYLFFIDVEGHADNPALSRALDAARNFTNQMKLLGSYPRRTEIDRHLKSTLRTPVASTSSESEEPAPRIAKEGRPLTSLTENTPATTVQIGNVQIGPGTFTLISGPCAVESAEQIMKSAAMVKAHGAHILRGGAFKPRSSPYSFQGLGFEGLDHLVAAGNEYEMPIVTEVLRPEDVHGVATKADMIQVGARNMQNFALLKALGETRRPILLKRGMSATIEEVLQAAEYIMAGGNRQIVLCERGIRTFETATRATLDVSAIPVLRTRTHLPIIVDPSHAAGVRHLVIPLALAAVAAGADGLIVEAHPNPEEALCDKDQALTGEDVGRMMNTIEGLCALSGRTLNG